MKFCMTIFLVLLPVQISAKESKWEEVLNRLDKLEQLVEKQNLVNQNQKNVIRELTSEVERMKLNEEPEPYTVQKRQLSTNVAFYTRLTKPLSNLGVHQHIEFNKVITDTTKFFNPSDGIFVAPTTGMYVFTWSISSRYGNNVLTELVVNGTPYGYLDIDCESDTDRGNGAQTVVIKVNQGQHVWIRVGSDASQAYLIGNDRDTFSGWLVFNMN